VAAPAAVTGAVAAGAAVAFHRAILLVLALAK
jgi:hypothetical protein